MKRFVLKFVKSSCIYICMYKHLLGLVSFFLIFSLKAFSTRLFSNHIHAIQTFFKNKDQRCYVKWDNFSRFL